VEWLPVNARGILAPFSLGGRRVGGEGVKKKLALLMLANHETGAIQPVKEFAKLLPPGVPLHTDAAQAVGKIPVNFRDLGATSLSASAHKFRGPVGIGLLLLKEGTKLKPHTFGGHQQRGIRPGTESVALAVGLATAFDYAVRNMDRHLNHGHALRASFLAELRKHECPFVLNGPAPGEPDGLPSTLNVSFPGARAELLLMALDLAGIACSTGSACSSGSLLPSPVLQAMKVPDDVLQSAMRFSFSPTQTEAEIVDAAARVAGVVKAMG